MMPDYSVSTMCPRAAERQRRRDRVSFLCLAVILAGTLLAVTLASLQNILV